MRARRSVLAVLLCATVLLSACSNGDGDAAPPPQTTTTTEGERPNPVGPPPRLELTEIAKLDRPTAMAQRDGDDSLYVAEKGGVVRTVKNGVVDATPVLDISADVSDDGERGLLGLAFMPKTSKFYVNFTNKAGNTQVVEYQLDNGGRADPRSRRDILSVEQPYANHNGGQLAFGPEGALYIALGDGGGAGDPQKHAQNLSSLLGKILRIRPEAPSGGLPYTIPFDNPFAKQAGARGEIWAYGLRNPWRFSFDKKERGIWIGDVGQNDREEIDHVAYDPKGGNNYGWPLVEGTRKQDGDAPRDAVKPVFEYDRKDGQCSVTGGYVYRGQNIPDMTGRYVFGDFCSGKIWSLTERGTGWESDELSVSMPTLASFGQDHNGELYVLAQNGTISRIDQG